MTLTHSLLTTLVLVSLVRSAVGGQAGYTSLELLSAPGVRPQVRGIIYSRPSTGVRPGLLILHGSAGLHAGYHACASDLSEAGYVVLLVDLYAETGAVEVGSTRRLEAWATWQATVRNALGVLRKAPGVDPSRIGIVGFSRGAWLAFTTAGNAADVRAIAAYYAVGTQPTEWQAGGPAVLLLYGDKDQYADAAFVERVAAGLRDAGRRVDLKVYGGAGHGFNFATSDDSNVLLATRDADRRLRAFLAEQLR